MMKEIVFATGNYNKVKELQGILGDAYCIRSLEELNVLSNYEETGKTFEENSCGKALYYSQKLKLPVVSDDSGLEIDALDKEPGVYSARYINPSFPYPRRCSIILDKLKDVKIEDRTARFRCAASLAHMGTLIAVKSGSVEGIIHTKMAGNRGFGYDPIFYYPEMGKTFAEMSDIEKNRISHRFIAFNNLSAKIREFMNE